MERNEVTRSMGESLVRLSAELEEERARTRAALTQEASRLAEIETLTARMADCARAVKDRDARILALRAERDELAKSLAAEADKVRRELEARRCAEAETQARITMLSKLLEEESARRALLESAAIDVRARLAVLADQVARVYQEKETVMARFSDWEKERQRLLTVVRSKDEMISLLSSTFQETLKKDS